MWFLGLLVDFEHLMTLVDVKLDTALVLGEAIQSFIPNADVDSLLAGLGEIPGSVQQRFLLLAQGIDGTSGLSLIIGR